MRKFSDTIVVVFTWILIFLLVGAVIMLFYVASSTYKELIEEAEAALEATPEPTSIEFDFNIDIDGIEYFKDHGPETYVFKTDEYDVEVTIYRNHVTISDNDIGEYVSIDFDQLYLYS